MLVQSSDYSFLPHKIPYRHEDLNHVSYNLLPELPGFLGLPSPPEPSAAAGLHPDFLPGLRTVKKSESLGKMLVSAQAFPRE